MLHIKLELCLNKGRELYRSMRVSALLDCFVLSGGKDSGGLPGSAVEFGMQFAIATFSGLSTIGCSLTGPLFRDGWDEECYLTLGALYLSRDIVKRDLM